MTHYMFDTEFSERGYARIDLISIAIVNEHGDEYYAVASDGWSERTCNPWVRENVLPHLKGTPRKRRSLIAHEIREFVRIDTPPILWAYYGDYDWVLLCQLFGTMLDLPEAWPKWCRDLKQLSSDIGSPTHPPDPTDAHNALADARWNRELWKMLTKIKEA